jgi:hypothetical protein
MKQTLIILVCLAGPFLLYGQRPVTLGVKAGISLANQRYRITPIEYTIETEPIAGPAITLFVEAFRGDHFSFQADIGYSVKGSRSSTQSVTVNHLDNDRIIVSEGEMTRSLFRYLSIAPMARFSFNSDHLAPYFLLGPRLDMQLRYSSDSDYPLTRLNGSILGLTGGMGIEFTLQRAALFTEILYQPDLTPVTGEDPLLVKNHMISITVGVRLLNSG